MNVVEHVCTTFLKLQLIELTLVGHNLGDAHKCANLVTGQSHLLQLLETCILFLAKISIFSKCPGHFGLCVSSGDEGDTCDLVQRGEHPLQWETKMLPDCSICH